VFLNAEMGLKGSRQHSSVKPSEPRRAILQQKKNCTPRFERNRDANV
jgi:hypothetical protein